MKCCDESIIATRGGGGHNAMNLQLQRKISSHLVTTLSATYFPEKAVVVVRLDLACVYKPTPERAKPRPAGHLGVTARDAVVERPSETNRKQLQTYNQRVGVRMCVQTTVRSKY